MMKKCREVLGVRGEHVSGLPGDAYLVLAAEFEPAGFFGYLCEEKESFVLLESVLLDSFDEVVDLHGDGSHGGGENGIELSKVGIMTRKVEGDGIECMGVLLKQ